MAMVFYLFYSLLLFIVLLIYGPFYLKRINRGGKYRPDLLKRLGFSLPEPRSKKGVRILIHSVSVGETRAVIPIINELKRRRPGCEIYLTTTTGSGQKTAEQIGGNLDNILYFPIDFRYICSSFLRRIRPDCICLTETELWPNFIRSASRYRMPLILINGRISDKSFRNYGFVRPFVKSILGKFNTLCMQSVLDARRIVALGAEYDKVKVTGNIKFELGHLKIKEKEDVMLRNQLGLHENQPVLVAGSTHPGEERAIFASFKRLLTEYPGLVLILAPRHVERSEEISKIVKEAGLKSTFWSRLSGSDRIKEGGILQIDVIGLLAKIYSLATIVIIGGSFVTHGGQNPLEPAFFGKPVIFGPHMENFRSISSMLMDANAAVMIQESDLFRILSELLKDKERREKMGKAARGVIDANKGAVKRTCDEILGVIRGINVWD
ncbi:MAG: 3-deoxy-D-manno-octulosonic acid transferase [bacterium]